MRALIRWAILNSPAMNTAVVALLVIGAASLIVMRREVFPQFQLEIVLVTVPFPGATPEETEEGICQKIEARVANLDGVRKVTSVAGESFGYVIVELMSYVKDVQKIVDDIRSEIDQVNFPPSAEKPEVKQIAFRASAISLGVLGPARTGDPETDFRQERELRDLAEQIREELLTLSPVPPADLARWPFASLFQPSGAAITSAEIVAAKPYEIAVEVSEEKLREHGLSLSRLASIVRFQNIEVPGGKMETAGEELLLRGKNKREWGPEIAEIPVLSRPNGDVVRLSDLGAVIDGFAESVSEHTINGRPGLTIRVSNAAEEDLFTVVEAVRVFAASKSLPAGYELITWGDRSLDVRDRLRLLTSNGLQGLTLVFISLALFLELRLAFWVAVGIPVSLLGAGFVLLLFGQTLNMLTMFAFLMAIGIVVDDGIVIGENIYEKRQQGMNPLKAAVEGTLEVIPSVFASVATTIIAFIPLMFVSGIMGKFIAVMPLAIIAMLVVSLLESTFVLPSHLSHDNNLFMRFLGLALYAFRFLLKPLAWLNGVCTRGMEWFIQEIYVPVLGWTISHKRISLATGLACLITAVGLIAAGVVPFAPFPKMDSREISATVAFPNGTSANYARAEIEKLEQAIVSICDEWDRESGESIVSNTYRRIGEVGDEMQGPTGITEGSHVATVEVQLASPDVRTITSDELIRRWRERVPKISGAEVLKFGAQSMGPGGTAIEFKLLASEGSEQFLDAATARCKEYLASKVGVFDIEDDARPGKSEVVFRLNELGKALGLDENQLASTIRTGFYGDEVMRLQRGRHEVKLMVRYPAGERRSFASLENVRVRDTAGRERPLSEVATWEYRRAFSDIKRQNQKRAVTITADVDAKEAVSTEIINEMKSTFIPGLLDEFRQSHGAVLAVDWEGEQAETMDSLASMGVGYVIALLAMFVLLTLEFKSYGQPVIIMAIIPFGLVGAVLGHALLGLQLTLFSFFGLVALTGVIVNDSIVLVDFINARLREGMPIDEAIMSAGRRRFRPIFLTTLTTVAGLFPMLLERSLQAQVLIPMAASLIFGLLTGTTLILVLVPVFYKVYCQILIWFGFPLVVDEEAVLDEKLEAGFPPGLTVG
jgi:hydrophobic/amphiphilic exporter-1 (mainly G- bacteria), HAE1 family